jgi:hypothetical protein
LVAQIADELHYAIDEAATGEQLHDAVALWELITATTTARLTHSSPKDRPAVASTAEPTRLPMTRTGVRRSRRGSGTWLRPTWEAAGLAGLPTTYACIGCLEQRLGRILGPAGFPPFDLNDVSDLSSPRLKARLGDQGVNSAWSEGVDGGS